jgi:hypothetical protein
MPVISTLGWRRQEYHEFEASLDKILFQKSKNEKIQGS